MPAPDLPPPPPYPRGARPLRVHLHARLVEPQALGGGVVIVIDALRASVTITAALANGATRVIPVLTVEDAIAAQRDLAQRGVPTFLGGERGGVLIPGFDLDNSPAAYTRERVAGRTAILTTTNGTAALLHARAASRVLVGSFANLTSICDAVSADDRPVHILCCGTREDISLDDVLPAGAMTERLVAAGRTLASDDSGRVAMLAYRGALAALGGLVEAMRSSRGGRNLANIGLARDVDYCSTPDTFACVPEFYAGRGEITLASR